MKLTIKVSVVTTLMGLLLTGCFSEPTVKTAKVEPEKLYIYEDGSMEFRNRPIDAKEVVIYSDGYGGEKAAVKVRAMEPIRPAFYRDAIVVLRKSAPDAVIK